MCRASGLVDEEGVTGTDGTVDAMPARDDPGAGTPVARAPDAALTVERVPAAATYPLRARVLRPGAPPEHVPFAADDHPDAAAFAARDGDGRVVGVAIVYPEACPWRPHHLSRAWRLRGMATDEDRRNTGVGRLVLQAVVDHVVASGGALIWCNARVTARRFYERAGFTAHGDVWDEPMIGPHIAMCRDLVSTGVQSTSH